MTNDVLLLNADMRPIKPIELGRAYRLVLKGRGEFLELKDIPLMTGVAKAVKDELRSLYVNAQGQMLYPLVVRQFHNRIINGPRGVKPAMTKKNILLRDKYKCQYCGHYTGRKGTVDHVTPKSKGGPATWNNLVCSCVTCNQRKANRTPKDANMPIRREPYEPKHIEWDVVRSYTWPDEWLKYVNLYHKDM